MMIGKFHYQPDYNLYVGSLFIALFAEDAVLIPSSKGDPEEREFEVVCDGDVAFELGRVRRYLTWLGAWRHVVVLDSPTFPKPIRASVEVLDEGRTVVFTWQRHWLL